MSSVVLDDLIEAGQRWKVWQAMAWQDIALRYKRSVIGPFWISIAMAIMGLSLAWLYSGILAVPFMDFLPHMFIGLVAWTMISMVVNEATAVATENDAIIRNVPVSLSLLAARTVARNLLVMAHNLVAAFVILFALGFQFSWTMILIVPGLAVYAVFGLLAGVVLGPLCARYRDVSQIIANIMQIFFFFTPIFWKPEMVSERPFLVDGNPFFHLLEIVRAPILGTVPTMTNWMVSLGMVGVLAIIAAFVIPLARRRMFLWL